jgi:hypothetical protein
MAMKRPDDAPARLPEPAHDPKGPGVGVTLARSPHAVLDRWLPARPWPFVAVALSIGALTWAAGWWYAADRARFLSSREWLVQPLYLAVHLGLLRAFTSVYAGNFEAGAAQLGVGAAAARARVRAAAGWGVAVAALVAAPFAWWDWRWMEGAEYAGAKVGFGAAGGLGVTDRVLLGVWTAEWFVNAYVWVLIVAFLWQATALLRERDFVEPVETVLREHLYRPFLLMNAQAATLTVVLAAASAGYVWLAEGEITDYVALWATAVLVLVAFVPPWLLLKKRIGNAVAAETSRLGRHFADVAARLSVGKEHPASLHPGGPRDVSLRLDAILSLLRIEHLDRLHDELGKSEAQSLVFRLVAPALTAVGRVIKPF